MAETNHTLLVFNPGNLLLARRDAAGRIDVSFRVAAGSDDAFRAAAAAALAACGLALEPRRIADLPAAGGGGGVLWFGLCESATTPAECTALSLLQLHELAEHDAAAVAPELAALRPLLHTHAIRIPYLNHEANDYIYRFRTEKQRNRSVYQLDERARGLYQSALCEAIKRLKRTKERTSDSPAELDFGAVRYVLPSHFGFCLGVQNAIERAYETIAENPGRRVFMLSELIHNPFVNEDLLARGLRYLQSDKGRPLLDPATGRAWWDQLGGDDLVIIPAFGATDEDKRRLVERGIAFNNHDATCMLVEKVWKAARRYGQLGFTVIIHGKHEHEETKATFSNSAKHAPSLIIRDRHEAEKLGEVVLTASPDEARVKFATHFAGRHSAGFDPVRDLDRVSVVNQTTLLRNETLGIIDLLEATYAKKHGAAHVADHLYAESRGDTLCYATQVNQDALERALALPLDGALVVGGKNSSNTFQLFRLCEAKFGARACYIQSERDIVGRDEIRHFVYPYHLSDPREGRQETRPFLGACPAANGAANAAPVRLLITGGASCPDGLIQQVVARINGFFPAEKLRPIEAVLAELEKA